MNKLIIFVLVFLLLILTIFLFYTSSNTNITGNIAIGYHTLTKAQCNETNFCQDYLISCNGKNLISMKPITGATIQNSLDWTDPRTESEISELC